MILFKETNALFEALEKEPIISFDSETTGLQWYQGDHAFIWVFGTKDDEYLIDLRGMDPAPFYERFHAFMNDPSRVLIGANSKFDLHMISGLKDYSATVHDIQVLARLEQSDRMKVSLDVVAKEFGYEKLTTVEDWIKKNKAYRFKKTVTGELEKIKRYDAVPEEIIYAYAARDARITYDIYFRLMERLDQIDQYLSSLAIPKDLKQYIHKQALLTRVLFLMEKEGFLVDEDFTRTAYTNERAKIDYELGRFKELTGVDLVDSAKSLTEVFGNVEGVLQSAPRTDKGNTSFTDSFLSSLKHPIAESIINYRTANKKLGTYYSNFLDLRCADGKIHTNFRQSRTKTGRLSSSEPNLQNVSSEEEVIDKEKDAQVRGCFIAPPDYYIVSIDYSSQEMRLMFDLAGEHDIINEIKNGADPHQATADLLGITRKQAKSINFGILYGMGSAKLAASLGLTIDESKRIKRDYFLGLRKVDRFVDAVKGKASLGMLSNISGRVYRFTEKFSYKAINYLIQGSSAEITVNAMLACEKELRSTKSRLVLSVHDELVFYMHKDEVRELVPRIKQLMVGSYEHSWLPMDVGIEIGTRWSELIGWDEWLKS